MIRRQHQHIIVPHDFHDLGKPIVEVLECVRIAVDITPVAVEHVEIDEIGEDDRVVVVFPDRFEGRVEKRRVAVCLDLLRDALVGIDIGYLADADDIAALLHELIEHGRHVWRRGQVATVPGAYVGIGSVADKRPRDDATDVVFVDEFARDVAEFV